jgi:hypothetical protein
MPSPKYSQPDEKVGLKITAAERNLLCEDVTFVDNKYGLIVPSGSGPVGYTFRNAIPSSLQEHQATRQGRKE